LQAKVAACSVATVTWKT